MRMENLMETYSLLLTAEWGTHIIVCEYKYLGFLMSVNDSLKPAITTLASKAKKATFSLIKTSMHLCQLSLFDIIGNQGTPIVPLTALE